MPTLDWMGKSKVVNHHRDVPYRILQRDETKSVLNSEGSDCGNMIVHGDNLEALKALLSEFEGRVDCIYIDPPYNTGNEGWVYNDNVNDPRIKRWLGEVVGKEGEDFTRHDKWLCMMYPRLQLLKRLLAPDGLLFVSIDDIEAAYLKLVLDEIFGLNRFIAQLIWKSRQNKDNRNVTGASIDHEYVFCYGGKLRGVERDSSQYKNPDNDPNGPWASANMVGLATKEQRPNLHYDLVDPETGINYGCPDKGWRYGRETMGLLIEQGRIIWPSDPNGRPRKKQYLNELESKYTGFPSIVGDGIFTSNGTKELKEIFGRQTFDFPKPSELIATLIEQMGNKNSIILDSFAGSGSTGHAVMKLNQRDGGHRRFILIEMGDYADSITAERARRVIKGYGEGDKAVAGVDCGFSYYELGPVLFDADGSLNESVSRKDVMRYVWHTECAGPFEPHFGEHPYYMGTEHRTAYYLAYEPNADTILTAAMLATFPVKGDTTVVYADRCLLTDSQLENLGVVFKQIPRQIARI